LSVNPEQLRTLTPETATWQGTTIISNDAAEQLRAAKARHEGDLLVAGSATLAEFLAANDLVDEYHLMVFPVVLGQGKRLFRAGATYQRLRLVEQRSLGFDRVQIVHYQPIPDAE
jgi:dihydrofolate reductase